MFKGKKVIIFDMDGTLIDSVGVWNKVDVELIKELGCLEELNDIVYTREDAKEIKPNPEIYLRIVGELKVRKEQCLIFEDSLIGIDAANNVGIEVVAIYDKYSDMEREEIKKKATYNLNNYEEVIQNLLRENL